jgi:hypothetical protein
MNLPTPKATASMKEQIDPLIDEHCITVEWLKSEDSVFPSMIGEGDLETRELRVRERGQGPGRAEPRLGDDEQRVLTCDPPDDREDGRVVER